MIITGVSSISGQQIIAAASNSAQYAARSNIATKDSDERDITATYQTTAGMTAYQPVGDYLTTADSANFYTTANESGFITGVDLTPYQTVEGMTAYQEAGDYYSASNPSGFLTAHQSLEGYLQDSDLTIVDNKVTEISGVQIAGGGSVPTGVMTESGLEYDASGNISAYSGSAFAAQLPEEEEVEFEELDITSISAATDYVSANSANINSTVTNVSANSGAWGGSALPISAGPGVTFSIVNGKLVFRSDETILYDDMTGRPTSVGSQIQLTESPLNFEYVEIFLNGSTPSGSSNLANGYNKVPNEYLSHVNSLCFNCDFNANNSFSSTGVAWNMGAGYSGVSSMTWTKVYGYAHPITSFPSDWFQNNGHLNIYKIVGLNRKA